MISIQNGLMAPLTSRGEKLRISDKGSRPLSDWEGRFVNVRASRSEGQRSMGAASAKEAL